MEPVKVVFSVNGSTFVCTNAEQLESFLSSGWKLYKEPTPVKKGSASKAKKTKQTKGAV